MPYGVSKWPGALDPRGLLFCNYGYKWGAFPPYLYHLQSTGALAPFDILNSGIVLPFVSATSWIYEAFGNPTWTGDPSFSLKIEGYETLQTSPVDHTIWISLMCVAVATPIQTGHLFLELPDAIGVRTLPALTPTSGPVLVPNPITMSPRIWSTPTTP